MDMPIRAFKYPNGFTRVTCSDGTFFYTPTTAKEVLRTQQYEAEKEELALLDVKSKRKGPIRHSPQKQCYDPIFDDEGDYHAEY